MKKSLAFTSAIIIIVSIISLSLGVKNEKRSDAVVLVAKLYQQEMEKFESSLKEYPKFFYDSSYEVRLYQYQELIRQFKKIEGLFTYYHTKLAYDHFLIPVNLHQRDFGPPFPDIWIFSGPFGIETDSALKTKDKEFIDYSVMFIKRAVTNFRKLIAECDYASDCAKMTDKELMDALHLQMIRMSTVGLGNTDIVIEEGAIANVQGEFMGWADAVRILANQLPTGKFALRNSILTKLDNGLAYFNTDTDYKKFNRMHFLVEYLIPLSTHFYDLRVALGVKPGKNFSALNENARHIYEVNALNADYFAPGNEAYYTKDKALLGKFLFFDPILSDNNKRSCASCHKPEKAFTDGNVKSMNFEKGDLPRNAPTVINSAFQKVQFWDLRASSLEDQLDSVINSPDELHSSFANVIDRLYASEEYKTLFNKAFPETKKTGIERKHVKIAIASYERELTGFNSRFDRYVRGDKNAMTEQEISGFNLYMGQAKCGTCHTAPLFSAPLPPYFNFTEHRSLGVPIKDTMDVYKLDPDTGITKHTKSPFFQYSFKVPTVRNSELTAPYMHNGVYKTLEQVIDFYNHAAGVKFEKQYGEQAMKGLPFFMILPDSLRLDEKDRKDLVAFIKALTDTTATSNVPKRLPKITGKHAALNDRKLGGEY